MMKLWIVTAVDYGDSCDGKARTLGTFKTYDEAKAYVDEDIRHWGDDTIRCGQNVECDFDKMSAWDNDDDTIRCEWNIEEIEVDA